jgi:hypothetical protein
MAPWVGRVTAGLAVESRDAAPRGDISAFTLTRPALGLTHVAAAPGAAAAPAARL